MDYDVLILGGGIIGCSVAYELSKYNFNIALIERGYDIVDDISFVNTAVVYDGSESSNDTTALLEKEGSELIRNACRQFNVECNKVGALRIARNAREEEIITKMYNLATKRGIDKVRLIEASELYNLESALKNIEITKALYSENVSVINPYDLAIAYGEVAEDNGVNFRFQEEVLNIEEISKGFKVITNKNKFKCKVVINTIMDDSNIKLENNLNNKEPAENMTYLLIDDVIKNPLKKIVIENIQEDSFLLNIPNLSQGSIIAIKNSDKLNKEEVLTYARNIIPGISENNIINIFNQEINGAMIIDYSDIDEGYIRVTGNHYSKITLAPAISKIICETISQNLNTKLKKNFNNKRREFYRFRNMTDEERNNIIKVDKRYGNIVCVCNKVTEGEIIDCIRRPLGARTVEGIKKRTGAGMGSCYGSYCNTKIINILANEMNKKATEIVHDSKNSNIWISRIKEFNEV